MSCQVHVPRTSSHSDFPGLSHLYCTDRSTIAATHLLTIMTFCDSQDSPSGSVFRTSKIHKIGVCCTVCLEVNFIYVMRCKGRAMVKCASPEWHLQLAYTQCVSQESLILGLFLSFTGGR